MEARKRRQIPCCKRSDTAEEEARGDDVIGNSNSLEESIALGQFDDVEAVNALDVGNHVGFHFKGDRVEVIRGLARIEEASPRSKAEKYKAVKRLVREKK
ncbi:hypothetical protein V6N13_135967 [Hibiscus sabdariffa]|uniref:Uncharacterized protein n=2 Tax=Hibiscus sabdariffa TaxID=183260 RepID=A0ABR2QTK3_9ROSI